MKKSFLIHCDSLSVIDKMADDQVGKLLRMMKSYHNGKDYVCDDFSVELVFEQFRNQFDRDLEKYDSVCERNRKNIKKRYSTKSTSRKSGIPKSTKSTDNDSDNDSDNKKDNILSEQEIKEKMQEIYGMDIITQNKNKFRLAVEFIKHGYDMEIEQKRLDKFFSDMIDKSHRYGYSAEGFGDRDTLLLKTKEMYEWSEGGKREIVNHMSTLNKFLAPTPKK